MYLFSFETMVTIPEKMEITVFTMLVEAKSSYHYHSSSQNGIPQVDCLIVLSFGGLLGVLELAADTVRISKFPPFLD